MEQFLPIESAAQSAAIFGSMDRNVILIENRLSVRISLRSGEENTIAVSGSEADVAVAIATLSHLKRLVEVGEEVNEQKTEYALSLCLSGEGGDLDAMGSDCICITAKGKPIKAKTVGQKRYVDLIRKNTVTLGIGPAGTGKTFLAVAMAVTALRRKEVSRIILTRPAVEAGERLGYLPGDLQSKIDPYLRPLYDALYETMGAEAYARNLEKGIIEIAPLAYMRGRTLDDCFIILDEAQNTTPEQMKMFLTRLGFGSRAVVTGDLSQTDLPHSIQSGLGQAVRILEGIEDIAIHEFTSRDVVRHRLVMKIIEAYDKHDREKAAKGDRPVRTFRKQNGQN
ncbi:MAG: PhoH family protein [Clostridia bacterium]|nr:PhoH family protein [Clostridia bacterium]